MTHISESAEAVAYRLFRDIAENEPETPRTREWILNTYAECLLATQGKRQNPEKRMMSVGPARAISDYDPLA